MPAPGAAFVLHLLLGVATASEVTPVPSALPACAAYQRALDGVRAGRKVSVEELFRLATAAGRELEADISRADEARAAGAEAGPALTQLEGFVVSWEEAIFAKPRPDFFLALANAGGRPVDRAFFELLLATRPHGAWPAYIGQQTDATGCVRFDLPELPALYARWLGFRDSYPKAYREEADREVRELNDWLTSDCSCGGRETVIRGLQAILRAVPRAPVSAELRERLEAIRRGTERFRFNCQSG